MNQREKSVLVVACYGHFLSHFNMLIFPALLLPLAGFYQMEMTDVLALSFWMYLFFGISSLPWGLASDKFGAQPLLLTFYIGAGLSAIAAALNVDNPPLFCFFISLIGLFSGIYHPAGLGWISKEIRRTSKAMATNGMFGNLGLASAPLIAGIINHFFGISSVYFVAGFLNLTGIVTILMIGEATVQSAEESEQVSPKRDGFGAFGVLLICMTLGGIVYRGASVTLPAYFELKSPAIHQFIETITDGIGSANVNATVLASLIYLVGMAGQYIGGRTGEKMDLRKGYLFFHLLTIPAAVAMYYLSDFPLFVIALIHGFFLLGMQPIENTIVARLTPPHIRSSAYGLKFVFTFGVGAFSLNIVEWVKNGWSFEAVFPALAIVSTMLCAAILLLWYVTKKSSPEMR